MSISGVLIGTLASNLLINAWWEPLILFKHGFDSTKQKFLIIYLSELVMVAGILSILIRFSTSLNTMNIFVQLIIFVIIGLILGFGITFFEYVLLRKMKILETTLFKRVK